MHWQLNDQHQQLWQTDRLEPRNEGIASLDNVLAGVRQYSGEIAATAHCK